MKATNENMVRLRELTNQMCVVHPTKDYEVILKKLKDIVDGGKNEISDTKSPQSKIKCYEKMCATITNILNNVDL